jgi:hypothetical protein
MGERSRVSRFAMADSIVLNGSLDRPGVQALLLRFSVEKQ